MIYICILNVYSLNLNFTDLSLPSVLTVGLFRQYSVASCVVCLSHSRPRPCWTDYKTPFSRYTSLVEAGVPIT